MTAIQEIPIRIPSAWDPAWFRMFIAEILAKADSRNVIGVGLTITADGNQAPTYVVTAADTAIDAHDADPAAHSAAIAAHNTDLTAHALLLAAHESEANPHPVYLTQAELDAQMAVQYATQYDQDADPPTVAYLGQAVPGTSTGAAGWRIQKLTFGVDGDVSSQWADGNANFDNVWTDRASLSYS